MVGAIQLSIMLGATIGGTILDHFSIAATFIFGTVMLVLAAVIIGDGKRLMPSEIDHCVEPHKVAGDVLSYSRPMKSTCAAPRLQR